MLRLLAGREMTICSLAEYVRQATCGEKERYCPPGASRSMMNYPARNSKYYREKAREIRRFAGCARSSEVRLQLLDLAELFDHIAARVEGRINPQDDVDEDMEQPIVRPPPQFRPIPIEMRGDR